ncbi:MAG: hypothetical protein MJ236_04730 [Clostridia bacterium]|nr:hypothetical protein [Clostridia bacterium]
MDTKEFLIEYNRMCHSCEHRKGCPLWSRECGQEIVPRGREDEKYFGKTIVLGKWPKESKKKENV